MFVAEKVVLGLCLFGGFLWLRRRAKKVDAGQEMVRIILGVFVLLPALLIGEKYVFDRVSLGPWTDLLLKAAVTLGNFPLIGWLFLRPGGSRPEA